MNQVSFILTILLALALFYILFKISEGSDQTTTPKPQSIQSTLTRNIQKPLQTSMPFQRKAIANSTSLCLDIPGASHQAISPVLLGCHGAENQQWDHAANKLMANHSKQCLELQPNMRTVLQKPCVTERNAQPNSAAARQQWAFDDARRVRSIAYPNLCLTSNKDAEFSVVGAAPCEFVVRDHPSALGSALGSPSREANGENLETLWNSFAAKIQQLGANVGLKVPGANKLSLSRLSASFPERSLEVKEKQIWSIPQNRNLSI